MVRAGLRGCLFVHLSLLDESPPPHSQRRFTGSRDTKLCSDPGMHALRVELSRRMTKSNPIPCIDELGYGGKKSKKKKRKEGNSNKAIYI